MEFSNAHVQEMYARIKVIIGKRKMKMKDFYEKSGITSSLFSQWNTGKTKPTMKSLGQVAEALDVDITEIIGEPPKDNETPAASSDGLSGDRKLLIDLFDRLDEAQQAGIIAQLQALVQLREGRGVHPESE